ncbi:FecR domain-containing protein [Cyclobacterium sp.]|uniref:FecR family protein n=1 Tax=Cyclobacterium sp. TaxID=1966343 RepID=UPI001984B0EC|nr:FecR domain-containing protein [Cyclobacterium sp.]MBD3631121.1 FecR domain-containing protein [Cyclobacterium sp.]
MKTKEDFLANQEFVAWVKQPNEQLDAYWFRWMAANPEQKEELKKAREILLLVRYPEHRAPEGVREEILQQLLKDKKVRPKKVKKNSSGRLGFPIWKGAGQFQRIAAILLFSFGLGWWLSKQPTETILLENDPVWIEKTTMPGEKLQLTLGDGSRIWLNANSSLFFPQPFDSLERRVRLIGEAYFEVEKDSLKPFHVETNGLLTTVLGTAFNVRNQLQTTIDISLVSGSVKVAKKASAEPVMLKPGQSLHHEVASGRQKVASFDPNLVLAWKEGWIRFESANLKEVLKTLEDWYGVKFMLKNEAPASWQFSGEYKEQTLEEVLRSMAYIQGFQFNIEEKVVYLKF